MRFACSLSMRSRQSAGIWPRRSAICVTVGWSCVISLPVLATSTCSVIASQLPCGLGVMRLRGPKYSAPTALPPAMTSSCMAADQPEPMSVSTHTARRTPLNLAAIVPVSARSGPCSASSEGQASVHQRGAHFRIVPAVVPGSHFSAGFPFPRATTKCLSTGRIMSTKRFDWSCGAQVTSCAGCGGLSTNRARTRTEHRRPFAVSDGKLSRR